MFGSAFQVRFDMTKFRRAAMRKLSLKGIRLSVSSGVLKLLSDRLEGARLLAGVAPFASELPVADLPRLANEGLRLFGRFGLSLAFGVTVFGSAVRGAWLLARSVVALLLCNLCAAGMSRKSWKERLRGASSGGTH